MSSPDDPDDVIDRLFDATEGIDALREIDWDEEETKGMIDTALEQLTGTPGCGQEPENPSTKRPSTKTINPTAR